jgi:hypothetical protein
MLLAVLSAACGVPSPGSNPDPQMMGMNPSGPSSSVLGRWRWPSPGPGLTMTTVLASDSFTMIADCDFTGVSLTATASAAASIDDTTIDVLSSAFDNEAGGGETCNAKISPGTFTYQLQGSDTLQLTAQGEASSLTLTRVSN